MRLRGVASPKHEHFDSRVRASYATGQLLAQHVFGSLFIFCAGPASVRWLTETDLLSQSSRFGRMTNEPDTLLEVPRSSVRNE